MMAYRIAAGFFYVGLVAYHVLVALVATGVVR